MAVRTKTKRNNYGHTEKQPLQSIAKSQGGTL